MNISILPRSGEATGGRCRLPSASAAPNVQDDVRSISSVREIGSRLGVKVAPRELRRLRDYQGLGAERTIRALLSLIDRPRPRPIPAWGLDGHTRHHQRGSVSE